MDPIPSPSTSARCPGIGRASGPRSTHLTTVATPARRRRRSYPYMRQLPRRRQRPACAGCPCPPASPPAVGAHRPAASRSIGSRGVDVVHGTNYVVPPSRLPAVVSVYDCWFLRHPERAQRPVRRAGSSAATGRRARRDRARQLARRRPSRCASCCDRHASRSCISRPLAACSPPPFEAPDARARRPTVRSRGRHARAAQEPATPRRGVRPRSPTRSATSCSCIAGGDGDDRPRSTPPSIALAPAGRSRVICTG